VGVAAIVVVAAEVTEWW